MAEDTWPVTRLLLISFLFLSTTQASSWPRGSGLAARQAQSTNASSIQAATISQVRHICPPGCDQAGPSSINWAAYHDVSRLAFCDQTMLLDFNLYNPLSEDQSRDTIRCCTTATDVPATSGANATIDATESRIAKRDVSACSLNSKTTELQVPLQVAYNGSGAVSSISEFLEASQRLSAHITQRGSDCKDTTGFAYSGSTVVGYFAGSSMQAQGLSDGLIQQFTTALQSTSYARSALVQLCPSDQSSRYYMGMVVNGKADVGAVQSVVATWASGKCVTAFDNESNLEIVTLSVPAPVNSTSTASSGIDRSSSIFSSASVSRSDINKSSVGSTSAGSSSALSRSSSVPGTSTSLTPTISTSTSSQFSTSNSTIDTLQSSSQQSTSLRDWSLSFRTSTISAGNATASASLRKRLVRRDYCSTVQVAAGDSCGSLASECGISGDQFTQYNPQQNLCSTLTPGQHVCCSSGTLPDYSPQPNSNGTCATYYIQTGDTCSNIAASNSLTVDQLNQFNEQTWGWMGCDDLQAAETMCLSSGSPPMPAVIPNANCGPQVPGTPIPASGTDLSTLNQCPLRACCDIWGQCGTTADFCNPSDSPTGAPGTAAQGQNGCISNCGTDINSGGAPSTFFKIGYFEAFNLNRPCLNQPITSIDFSGYTHVHLSFAVINPSSWTLDVSAIQTQFDSFVGMSGFNKILAVGGWAFSTDPATYNIFRQAMSPGNRDTLAANIVTFLENYDLDGIDIDYEYPGEPDIPGIPFGTKDDCDNYLYFMESLKSKMPKGKTVSFTAPASFWYLRAFRLAEMAFFTDYIVYMTYDLHGQWDYANKWSDPGCPGGNCLRSHVNLTETFNALSMITKAGVPSNMIVVGVSSYGRSFQMTTPGCTTEQCTYTGPGSGALAGACTGTPGYISNAEIAAILAGNATVYDTNGSPISISGASISYDSSSNSDILVYNNDQWVAYMSDQTKHSRAEYYQGFHFLGTADWAVDLQSFEGDGSYAPTATVTIDPVIWSTSQPQVSCAPPCIFVLPPYPLGYTSTITWPLLTTTLLSSSNNVIYTVTTTIVVPQFTITDVSLQPVTLQPTDTATYKINPVQSVTPSSFIYTLPPDEATFPPTQIPTSGASIGGPGGVNNDPNPTSSSTTVAAAVFPGVTFQPTPITITIQPQPTFSITIPTPPIPPITISTNQDGGGGGTTNSGPPCRGSGCGSRDCGIFGCGGGCGIFGCNGGCGIFGCGGGCGISGCRGGCSLSNCGGAGCSTPGSCGGSEEGGDGDNNDDQCTSKVTASACTYTISSYSTAPMTASSTTTITSCSTSTVCDGTDSSTTETADACSSSISSRDASAALAAGTMINGQLWPTAVIMNDPPGFTGDIGTDHFGYDLSSSSSSCTMCYWSDGVEALCTEINGCTQSTSVTSTSTSTSSTTSQVVVPTTVSADCESWIEDAFFWYIQINNIDNWLQTDYGKGLLDNLHGTCGSVWYWTFDYASSGAGYSSFVISVFIEDACVEKAIVLAGGPKLSCAYQGLKDKRDDFTSTAAVRPQSFPTPDVTFTTTPASPSPYPSMTDWPDGQTVTITLYNTTLFTTVYGTTTVITNGTVVPLPASVSATTTSDSSSTFVDSSISTTFSASVTTTTTDSATSTTTDAPSTTQSTPTDAGQTTTASSSTPVPTQSGIASNCNAYYTVQSGDSCTSIESQFDISFSQFYAWNPAINSDCSALWIGDAYCVGVSGDSSGGSSSTGAPVPTQSGIASDCTQYYTAQSGDSCSSIESQFSISFNQLYAWNPAIGSDCSALWVGEAYCVSAPDGGQSSGGGGAPAPTQSGIASNCSQYYTVQSGDSCDGIESQFGISFDQFYGWNPAIGSDCSALWVGDAYCVAVSS